MCQLCDENIHTCNNCYWGQVDNKVNPDTCSECNYSTGKPSEWLSLGDIFCRQCGKNLKENKIIIPESIKSCNNEIRAHWEKHSVDISEHPYHCSNCGWSNYHIPSRYILDFKRCPECGAIMKDNIIEREERER